MVDGTQQPENADGLIACFTGLQASPAWRHCSTSCRSNFSFPVTSSFYWHSPPIVLSFPFHSSHAGPSVRPFVAASTPHLQTASAVAAEDVTAALDCASSEGPSSCLSHSQLASAPPVSLTHCEGRRRTEGGGEAEGSMGGQLLLLPSPLLPPFLSLSLSLLLLLPLMC